VKILAVTLRWPPYVAGGYELLTRDAVEGLRRRGHSVSVLCGEGERHLGQGSPDPSLLPWLAPSMEEPGGGERDLFAHSFEASNVERLRLHFLRPANYRATRRAIAREDPDLLLFFNLGLVSLAPVLAARRARVATLGYLADPWPENHWLRFWRADERARRRKALRLALLERAWRRFRARVGLGRLASCSEFLKRELVADGIPEGDVEVLPLCLPADVEPIGLGPGGPGPGGPGPGDGPLADRAQGAPLEVVCTSSLWEGKGQDVLLRALALCPQEVRVTFAGGGTQEWRARLEALVRELGLAERVRFAGRLERAELLSLLARSHVLAMPSVWGEPFGLATLEGMARGLAVVVSDAGASPEIVRDREDGLVVAAGDPSALAQALGSLASDEGLRLRLARAGRAAVVERFGRERFLDGLEAAIGRVLGAGPGCSSGRSSGRSSEGRAT